MGDVLTALAITAFCVASWLGLFLLVPRWLTSMFRYDLWRLRDDLVDALRDGRLSRSEAAVGVLHSMETAIRHARHFTFANVLGLQGIAALSGVAPTSSTPSYAELDQDERQLLHSFERRLVDALVRHVKLGSPSGWLAMAFRPVALSAFHVGRLVGTRGRRPTLLVAEAVREELAVAGRLAVDRRDLSACV